MQEAKKSSKKIKLKTNGGDHGEEWEKHSLFHIWRRNKISMLIHVFGKGNNPITTTRPSRFTW